MNLLLSYLVRPFMKKLTVLIPLRQRSRSSPSLDDLWHRAFEHYGLMRPADVTEIHVFRVILQSSRDKNACTRSVTRTGPMSDPFQTLKRIIDEWWDLELEEHDPSWMLSPVNSACTWSSTNDFSSPAYVLTRKGNSISYVHMGFWKWYGDTDSGQPPLPSLSGSTITIVLVYLPRCAGPSLPRPVLFGVITLDSARSLLSVTLGLSFKSTSRLLVAT